MPDRLYPSDLTYAEWSALEPLLLPPSRIGRPFQWPRRAMAAAEKINPSYVSRVLRLTLLAPDIVEAILDGRQL